MQMIDGQMVSPRRFVFASVLALVLCTVCVGGVSGAADISWYDADKDTFNITTAEQLAGLASLVNAGNTFSGKTVLLGSDIDLKDIDWTPIGKFSNYPFAGTFNGSGYMIDNLHLTGSSVLGLFGYVSGTVQNVNINTCEIDPPNSGCTMGSLVGIIKGGVVKDSAVTELVVANIGNKGGDGTKYTFGGLVGQVLDSGGYEVKDTNVDHYIQGVCYVASAKALDNKEDVANNVKFGLICGGPSVGTVSGESTHSTCIITVVTTDSGVPTEKTETRSFEPGLHTVYTILDGYFLTDMAQSPEGVFNNNTDGSISGTLEKDKVYTLTIYQTKITYTVTIPETFEIKDDADTPGVGKGTAVIYASNVALPADSCIILKVSSEQFSDHSFNLKHVLSSDFTLPYTLSAGDNVLQNDDVFAEFTKDGYVTLTASVNSRPQLAGEYQDILTVTVEKGRVGSAI